MNRQMLAVSILTIWVGALGWLLARETGGAARGSELLDAERAVEPGSMFYQISMAGVQVGFATNSVDTVPDGLLLEDRMLLEVPALGSLQRTEVRTIAHLTNGLRLRSFEAGMIGDPGRFTATGEVSGDTLLSVRLASDQSSQDIDVRLEEPIVLPVYIPLRVAFGGELEIGQTYRLRTFDPLLLQHRDVEVEILDDSVLFVPDSAAFDSTTMRWVAARMDTVPAWRITQTVGGISTEAWIDGFGRIVSASSGMGLTIERTAFEVAFLNFRNRDRAASAANLETDIIQQTAIASGVSALPDRDVLRVRLGASNLASFDLDGGRQTLMGDTLEVRREEPGVLRPAYRIPAGGPELNPYVTAEPLIQSEDPRIGAQARQIVGRTTRPDRAAERLVRWVYENLDKQITLSVPSALDVLNTRRGDCNEHTILFVALARSVGLPARTAAGLVHVDGRFYYHAWPEVYLGDWVPVDPTFGQFPADASHLRFTIGGLARQTELIPLIGELSLEVLANAEQ